MRSLNFISLIFLLLFYSCGDKNHIPHLTGELEVDSLILSIADMKHRDVDAVRNYSLQLLEMEEDPDAQLIGEVYYRIANFYAYNTESAMEELEEVYQLLAAKEFILLRLEIDFLIINYYYLYHLPKKAASRLEYVVEYIDDPSLASEKEVLLQTAITRHFDEEKKEKVKILLQLKEKFESAPWGELKSRVYQSLGLCYLLLGEKEKSIETLEAAIPRDLENGYSKFASEKYLILSEAVEGADRVVIIQKAIDLAEQSGHTRILAMLYRMQGHFYFNIEQYEEGIESYRNTIENVHYSPDHRPEGGDFAYLGWAIYHNNNADYEEAIRQCELGHQMGMTYNDNISLRISLERKIWILREEGFEDEAKEVEEYLMTVTQENLNQKKTNEDLYFESRLKMLTQSRKNTQYQQRQRLILLLLGSSIAFLMVLSLFFFQRSSLLKKIRGRNVLIEKQMDQIEEINQELQLKNKQQESELKQKLLMLANNLQAQGMMVSIIESSEKIPTREKKMLKNTLSSPFNMQLIEDIDFQFLDLHSDFQKRLVARHPHLSAADLKLCIYVKMNLSNKEIAALQFKSPEAVRVSQSRLRKKLNLSGDISSLAYLNSV